MRTLAILITLLVASTAAAVEQADDAEVPPQPSATQPAPAPNVEPQRTHASDVLLPAPAGYQYRLVQGPPVEKRHTGLIVGGLVTFGAVWLTTAIPGIVFQQTYLVIPIVGPIVEMVGLGSGSDALSGWGAFLLVSNAAAQLGGLAMAIAGGVTTSKKPGAPRLELVPLGAGAAVRGTF